MGKVQAISVFPQPKNRTKKEKVSDGIQYRQIPLFQWFYKYSVFAFCPLYQICNLHFYASILSTTIILSTQPYYISILSTLACHSVCFLSLNFKEFDRIENAVKSHLNATNSLKPKTFHTLDFRPLDINTTHTTVLPLFHKSSMPNLPKSEFG